MATPKKPKSKTALPEVALYPYQKRWVKDGARFKLAVKATQIGYSFAAALEAVLDCLEHRTLWIVLSRGQRQSDEFMQWVREHTQGLRIAASEVETSFFEQTEILQREIKFPNGARILGLPANPDTARGYTGNMILDEFAFHQQDRDIWAAAFGRISRGDHKLRVISTPNGQRGKYYELAKELGLTSGSAAARGGATIGSEAQRPARSAWSGHWCDVHTAVTQGCPIDVEPLRRAMGDPERWQQEYECVFLSASDQYIPLDLIVECEHPQASVSLPSHWQILDGERLEDRECYFGYDVARVHDLAVLAVVEKIGDVLWTRAVIEMPAMKFSEQEKILGDVIPFCRRGAIDATGLGSEMAERLAAQFPGRVEPVSFTSGRKQEMAVRMKRHFEERTVRIPDHRALRRDLTAVGSGSSRARATSASTPSAPRKAMPTASGRWRWRCTRRSAGRLSPLPREIGRVSAAGTGRTSRSQKSGVRSQKDGKAGPSLRSG